MGERFPRGAIEQSIAQRFGQACAQDPQRVAVLTRDAAFSYREIDQWANAIAASLLDRLGRGSEPVPLLGAQGPWAIATTLGILKAGKFYVALDPSWTIGRVCELLAQVSARIVVADGEFAPLLREQLGSGLVFEPAPYEPGASVEPLASVVQVAPNQPAYLYFTSGSTGTPKGVIDCHRNVLHNVMRYTNALEIDRDDRLTLMQSVGFSGAVSSMFAALLNGATSCPIDLRGETPARIADWIGQTGITIYHSVPSIFRSLASAGRRFDSVRVVRLEGDRATRRDLELFRAHFGPRARVAVGLGATETGLVCQYFFDHDTELPEGVVPIGHAVDGVRVELRDTDGAPVATGTTGEIVVTSRFLATGYWRDPAADARAFGRADDASGERSYRTGDLGRFRADGCLEYLGRLDGRVRIGGQWVATAEVEAALASLPGVREAAVAAVDTDGAAPRLVAWFVPELLPAPSVSSLRRGLAARLPAQMLPSRFIALERLALGAHGKVDRTLLALPAPQRPHLDTEATEPRSLVQLRLRELWEELFGFGPIGVHDDFFELGGDSLLAMSMLERVEDICGRRVPPSVLLGAATIEHLARAVLQRSPELQAPIVAIRASGSRPPLFFLHGDYLSGGLYCLELSRHLGPEQPFYAIAPCGFDGEPPPASYEAMAERHLEAIRAVQPEGPYLLAGQCNGGLVAYEIARRLSAAGEQVALLAMIASSARNLRYRALWRSVELAGRAIGMPGPSRRHAFERLRSFLVHQRGLPPSRRLRHVAGKASALRREVSALAGRVAAEAAPARVAAAERPRAQVAAAERPPAPIAAADGVAGAREHLWEFYQRIDRGYVPRRYDGRISLIWPTEGDERAAEAARWWRRVVAGLDLYEIRGSHTSCLTRHVGELAGALRAAVERT